MRDVLLLGGVSDASTLIYLENLLGRYRQKFGRLFAVSFKFEEIESTRKCFGLDAVAQEFDRVIDTVPSKDLVVAICSNTYGQVVSRMRHAKKVCRIETAVLDLTSQMHFAKMLLLATSATVESSFYSEPIGRLGKQVILPSGIDQVELDKVIYDRLCQGENPRESVGIVNTLIRKTECDAVLLGCTELTLLAPHLDNGNRCVVDSAMIHIERLAHDAFWQR